VNTLISAIEQVERGHHVVLAMGLSAESDMSAEESWRVEEGVEAFKLIGGKVVLIPSLMRQIGWHDWQAYREIRQLVDEGFDIVHTHTSKAGVLGRLAASKGNSAVVHTPHGHIFHGYFSPLKTKLFIAIERWLAKKSDALIALTKAEMDDHLRLGIGREEQWHVIPSGVDVERIAEIVDRRRVPDESRKWDAVSVGRLVPVKGMDRLLNAWADVVKRKPDARLVIVGDGEERSLLEQQATSLGISEQVHFAGWSDPTPYLADANSFVLLSRNEGMGRAVVEAFAASLPCVVSDVCGLSELVDESVGAVVDAFEFLEAERELELDIVCVLGVVRQLVTGMLMETELGRRNTKIDMPLHPCLSPLFKPTIVVTGLHKKLHLHLLELSRPENEIARRDFIAKSLANLCDTKRDLFSGRLHDIQVVHIYSLRCLRPQVDDSRIVFNRPHVCFEHEVKHSGFGKRPLVPALRALGIRLPGFSLNSFVVASEAVLTHLAVDQGVRETRHVPGRLPYLWMHQNCGIDTLDVVALVDHGTPPSFLEVLF